MQGNEKIRHCDKCRFNVYDFSQMTQEEIDLVLDGDKVCGRLFLRSDGTYLTKDCQKKLARKKQLKFLAWAAVLPAALLPFINFNKVADSPIVHELRNLPIIGSAVNYVFPQPVPPPVIMGWICPPNKVGGDDETEEEL